MSKMKSWLIINSLDGNDSFSVIADTLENAALQALGQLNWGVYTDPNKVDDKKSECIDQEDYDYKMEHYYDPEAAYEYKQRFRRNRDGD